MTPGAPTPTQALAQALALRATQPARARQELLWLAWECRFPRIHAEAVAAYAAMLSVRARRSRLLALIHHQWRTSDLRPLRSPTAPIHATATLLDTYPDLWQYAPLRASVAGRLRNDTLIATVLMPTTWRHAPDLAVSALRAWAIFPRCAGILQSLAPVPGALASLPEAVWTAWLTSGIAENRLAATLLVAAHRRPALADGSPRDLDAAAPSGHAR